VHAALDPPRVEQESGMALQVTENRNASEEQEKAKSKPHRRDGMGTCKDVLRGWPVVTRVTVTLQRLGSDIWAESSLVSGRTEEMKTVTRPPGAVPGVKEDGTARAIYSAMVLWSYPGPDVLRSRQ
jgi:hypothetical protein